jgi:hypothetical protein
MDVLLMKERKKMRDGKREVVVFLKDEDELKVGRCRVRDMGRVTLDVSSQIATTG